MSIAPHTGIVDFGTFTAPTALVDGIQGEVPMPLAGQENYVLTASGFAPVGGLPGVGTVISVGTGTGLTGGPITTTGTIAIDSTVATLSGTQTLTNKRITPRPQSVTSNSATYALDTDSYDIVLITGQTATITSITTTGTPTNGQKFWISITGTAAVAFTLSASYFESSTVTLPTTTVTTARLDIGFVWNAATSRWRCVAQA